MKGPRLTRPGEPAPSPRWQRLAFWKSPFARRAALGMLVAIFLWTGVRFLFQRESFEEMPDFSAIASSAEMKTAFFDYLRPRAEEALKAVRADRQRLLAIETRFEKSGKIRGGDAKWLRRLAERYEVDIAEERDPELTDILDLKNRVDIIPLGLILAQASIESGWGSSRFARDGNNLFGMRCYTPGCGIVPKRRAAGAKFEVTRFDNLAHCFTEYVLNLNTHNAYADLRRIRRNLREAQKEPTGYLLAPGLSRYSEEGWRYVSKVQSVIRSNRLDADS